MSPDQDQCAFGKQAKVGVTNDAGFLGDSGDFQIRTESGRCLAMSISERLEGVLWSYLSALYCARTQEMREFGAL